tara:strand:+ start:7332 stop:8264 length:933 start_codon:yes stop_codon:yes gene_type:complete
MINKKFFIILILFNLTINFSVSQSEIFIKAKVNNEIITNLDVKNEKNYLIALNPKLKTLEDNKLERYAVDSIINEKIKKIEIENYFEIFEDEVVIGNILTDLYSNIGIGDLNEFENYLKNNGIDINQVRKKISIEVAWNEYIVKKFSYAIKIDENKIREKVNKIDRDNIIENFLLSEIIFTLTSKDKLEDKFKLIKDSISSIGFEESAKVFSLSESKNNGGSVGWVYKSQLSKKIAEKIENLEIGKFTDPIPTQGGFMILKLSDKKNEKLKINKTEELKNAINYEKNRQLTRYSTLQYKRIYNKATINEF